MPKVDDDSSKISIIMPTFNRADMIEASVKSIMAQEYRNWELLILDDGSTDNTEAVVRKIGDSRISLHKFPHCGSPGRLKNEGLKLSSGGLVAFNDSDDLWLPGKLEKQLEALARHPEAGFCLSNGYNFVRPGEPLQYFYRQPAGERFDKLFFSCFRSEVAAFTQALIFRKKCLGATGLFDEEKIHDRSFIVALAFHFKGVILYEPLVSRRLHPENFSRGKWKKDYRYEEELVRSYRQHLPPALYSDALFRLFLHAGEDYLKQHHRAKAARLFLQAWKQKKFSFLPAKKLGKIFWG